MQVKSILNRIDRPRGFVYSKIFWSSPARDRLQVTIRARKNNRPVCSGCLRRRKVYDRLPTRPWEYVPLWGIAVMLCYAPRRVNCLQCGVKVELMPWNEGKYSQATSYRWFLARWAKRLSWLEVSRIFGTSWDSVYRAVQMAVAWGCAHRDLTGIEAIGVDEVAWQKGHRYATVVYQIDGKNKRLLWVGQERTIKTLLRFFRWFGRERAQSLKFVCSDMWKAYLRVIAKKAGQALHVLDRFHIVANLNKAIDQVRAEEARQLNQEGSEPVLKNARWCLLKRPENLTDTQAAKLSQLLRRNLKSIKAHLLAREFDRFWSFHALWCAADFLVSWCRRVQRTKIEPMKKAANSMHKHGELILNYVEAKGTISAGTVEGFNNKLKLHTRKAYGFRTYNALETALYHGLGNLPEPNHLHRFC